MTYPEEISMFTWKEFIFCCSRVECSVYAFRSILSTVLSPLFPYWFSGWCSIHRWKWGIKIPYHCGIAIYFYLNGNKFSSISVVLVLSMFSYINFCSIDLVGCIYIFNYVFMVDWPFYHYIMFFFISRNSFWCKVHFMWYQ